MDKFLSVSTYILMLSVSIMLLLLTYNLIEMWGKQIQSEYERLTAPVENSHDANN